MFVLCVALCSATCFFANPVSRQNAQTAAQAFLQSRGKTMQMEKNPYKAPRRGAAAQNESAYYYVFNAGADNGYVIVSGDDRTEQILGYVEKGTFDANQIPENMKSWLQLYADEIKYLDENNIQAGDKRIRKAAARNARPTRHSVPVLMKALWNQGDPYNLSCPKYYKEDGTQGQPASGCVATALAQVMHYYRHPEKIKATIPAITNTYTLSNGTKKSVTTKNIIRNTPIDWDNMLDSYVGGETEEQRKAVGDLMYYIGQSVNMGYGASSGAVFGSNVAKAFINYFDYDDGAYMASRGDYSIDEWFDMIYEEIASGHPVGYSGSSSGGAHAFVLDGFDGDNLFHVNWGWGGGSNGWFLIGILNPGDNSGIGASSSSDGYSMGQNALMNVRLPDNVKTEQNIATSINDIKVNADNISINANFINWTGSTNNFDMGIVKIEDDSTYTLIGTKQTHNSLANNHYVNKTFYLNKKLPEGIHRISPASKLSRAKLWRPKYKYNSPEYIQAEVDSNGVTKLTLIKPVEDIAIDTIIFPGNRKVGDEQEVKVIFKNNGDEYYREVHFFASTTDTLAYQNTRSIVAVKKGETVTVSYFFKPQEAGVYNLSFSTNKEGTNIVGVGTMEILSEENVSQANLKVLSFSFKNSVSGTIYGNRLVGNIRVVNNNTTDYVGRIKLQTWRQAQGSNTAYSSVSQTAEVNIPAKKSVYVPFEFTNLDYGPTYRIQVNYVGQSGSLDGGGLWDHGWVCRQGVLYWSNAAELSATAATASLIVKQSVCAVYENSGTVRNIRANKNPNTIYVFDNSKNIPRGLENSNLVIDGHAEKINLENANPYYCPITFTADTANFHYLFPETTNGTKWETFTLPFAADSISIDGVEYALNDEHNHFWLYEFAYLGDENEVIFSPAKELRGNTPYIIAADSTLANKTLTFSGHNVPFYQSGTDKMLVSSDSYGFYGTTYENTLEKAYVINEEGNAFTLSTEKTDLTAMSTYFLPKYSESQWVENIPLPEIPKANTTGVINTFNTKKVNMPIYNIMGQKVGTAVNGRVPSGILPGVYVVSGKKILVTK